MVTVYAVELLVWPFLVCVVVYAVGLFSTCRLERTLILNKWAQILTKLR